MYSKQVLQKIALLEIASAEPQGIAYSDIDQEFNECTLSRAAAQVLPTHSRLNLLKLLFREGIIKINPGSGPDDWCCFQGLHRNGNHETEGLIACEFPEWNQDFRYALTAKGGVVFAGLVRIHLDRLFIEIQQDEQSDTRQLTTITATNLARLKEVERSMEIMHAFYEIRTPVNEIQVVLNWQPLYWHQPITGYSRSYETISFSRSSLEGYTEFVRLRAAAIESLWWREIGFCVNDCRDSYSILKMFLDEAKRSLPEYGGESESGCVSP